MCMASCVQEQPSDAKHEHTHKFGEWVITEAPTCTNNGTKVRYCSCTEKQSESIPSLSHTIVTDEAVEPTCTSIGFTGGKHCSVCNEVLVAQMTVDALGHTEVIDAAVPPTCTMAGLTEGKHCYVCNGTIVAQTVVDALGHTETVDSSVASTCTATGLTEGKHCSVCNEIIVAQIETPKINHSYDDKHDESCNECGFIRDAECAHTNVNTQPAKSATCTEPGLTEGKVCVKCEEVIVVQTVINALGHTEVVDAAVAPTHESTGLSEGKHCSDCGTVIIAQHVIPMLKIYTITYENIKTATYPTVTEYIEQIGVDSLPKISVNGYRFVGWYTEPNGNGKYMDKIPKENTGNITLHAHWELYTYVVTCKNVYNYSYPESYSVENPLVLNNPEWSGLIFTHWTDENGNEYTPDTTLTIFPEDMTGRLTLTANWKSPQNLVTPVEGKAKLYSAYSDDDGFLYFLYELGTIENVVLECVDKYQHNGGEYNFTTSETVTISERYSTSVAKTISKAVSSTTAMESSYNWAKNHTEGWNSQWGGNGAEFGWEPIVKIKFQEETKDFWGEDGTDEEWSKSHTDAFTIEDIEANTINSSFEYNYETSITNTKSFSISKDMPKGYYTLVHAGNIRVYAVIRYEIETGNLYLNTYSKTYSAASTIMYYENSYEYDESIDNPIIEKLDFTIIDEHRNEIINKIENSYYVKYDANGGSGTMPTTMHTVGITERISEIDKEFTKNGYKFEKWEVNDCDEFLEDGAAITNLGDARQTVTLKAVWTPITYTIEYDPNGGNGTMSATTCIFGVKETLTKNTYTKDGYEFKGWELKTDNGTETLEDGKEIINLSSDDGTTITLKAIWDRHQYSISFDYNNPSKYDPIFVTDNYVKNQTIKFGESYVLPTPKCNYFEFKGWEINGKIYEEKEGTWDIALNNKSVTAVAIWEKEYNDIEVIFDSGRTPNLEINDKSSDQNLTYVQLNIPKEMLLAYGYKELRLYIEIYLAEVQEGKQNINIKSYSKETLKSIEFIYTPGECTKTEGMVNGYSSIELAYVDENCGFWVSYFGSGEGLFDNDAWLLKHTFIVATPQ